MTFYEAAVEILRSAGRPLHVKKITALSIKQDLLTHVGREPEKTMRARLSQEVAKTGESIVRNVRPNVYALRDDADPDAARQTVQPRAVEHIEDHKDRDDERQKEDEKAEKAHAKNRGDGDRKKKKNDRKDSAKKDASTKDGDNTTQKSGRKKTSRRKDEGDAHHQNNGRGTRHTDDKNAKSRGGSKKSGREKKTDTSARQRNNERNDSGHQDRRRTSASEHASPSKSSNGAGGASKQHYHASPAAQKLASLQTRRGEQIEETAGDLAAHIRNILKSAPNGLRLRDIGKELDNTAYAALPQLPLKALRGALTRANARRAHEGRPPLFTISVDDRWSLIEDEAALSQSLQTLSAWQEQHRAYLVRRLERVIAERTDKQLLGIIALAMERLGYKNIEQHPAEGDEIATFSACFSHGLSESRVAARVFAPDRPVTRLDIMTFRGNLHQYHAERGVMFTLGGHSLCAREQVDAPNAASIDLLHDGKLAELMIRTHVGTTELKVSVPHLDHAFFE